MSIAMTPLTLDLSLLGESLEAAIAIAPADTWETWLHTWLTILQPDLSPISAYEVSLQFTSDQVISHLNRDYRHQDKPTDVLAFAAIDDAPLPSEVLAAIPFNLGDIIISVETAERQRTHQGHSLREELAWLTAHGLLHLLGWDHPDETSLKAMLEQQQQLLTAVGLSTNVA